jgi:carbon-monoxide dehydrogenase large subunit
MTVEAAHPLLGARVPRVEDARLTSGDARYLDDLTPSGTLHLRLVRSQFARARVVGVTLGAFDPPPPGTVLVTGDQVDAGIAADVDDPSWQRSVQPVLARDQVRFVGEPVCAVLHEDPYVAEDAAETVVVEYEPHDPVVDLRAALADGAPLVHEGWRDNVFVRRCRSYGDLERGRTAADRVVRRVFRTHRQAGVPLEGRGCLAIPEFGGRALTLWSSTQMPHLVRTYVAAELGLEENRLRVVAPDVGGGFGVKGHVFAEEVLVCALALRQRRPVKWVEDRSEHLLASIHARDHLHLLEAHVTAEGRITALRAQLVVDAGAYSVFPWTAGSDSGMAAKVLLGPYDVQDYEVEDIAVATNKCPLGTYRGVGRPSAVFAMERLMDEIAHELGLDPFDVRRTNLIRDFPYRTPTGLEYDEGSYSESLERVAVELDVDMVRAAGAKDRRWCTGVGVALYNEQSAHGALDFEVRGTPIESGYESVTLRVAPSGDATLHTGLQSHGQGLETTLAQVVAYELGLAVEQVRVVHGDTATSPYAMGTWGSRGAVLGGGAARRAALAVRAKVLAIGAHALGRAVTDVELRDGCVAELDGDGSVPFADIAYWANRRVTRLPDGLGPGLEATVFLDGPDRGTFSNACHGAVVDVDRETGRVAIRRYVVVEDCGTMINPTVVDGQVHGGVAQGIGSALLEEIVYSPEGDLLTSTFMDYLMPCATDVPDIEVHHLVTPSPHTEYGMKGMGESGAIGPMAAIANAVADALGVCVTETPLRLERVWRMARGDATRPEATFDAWVDVDRLRAFWERATSSHKEGSTIENHALTEPGGLDQPGH